MNQLKELSGFLLPLGLTSDACHRCLLRCYLLRPLLYLFAIGLTACQASNPPPRSTGHLTTDDAQIVSADIPPMVTDAPILPKPSLSSSQQDTFTVIVDSVPVKELLFSMARDARLNLDIDDDISSYVTINAVEQSLPTILARISELVDIRYQLTGDRLVVTKDNPFFKSYRISYLNMSRETSTSVSVATQINSTGQGAGDDTSSSSENSNSQTSVTNLSYNQFWDTLEANIRSVLRQDQLQTAQEHQTSTQTDSESEADSLDILEQYDPLVVNREAGLLGVTATQRQHADIDAFLKEILQSAQRQVLIEATIAEVTLSDTYQAGVDWQMIQADGLGAVEAGTNASGTNIIQDLTGANLSSAPSLFFRITDVDSNGDRLDTTLKALEQFGEVEVMSSPKLMALNNQTAMLKVVDNIVYFSVEVDTQFSETGLSQTEIETHIHTIPVGLVMSVTPYIDEFERVILNVRPTISRIIGTVQDPNPLLADANVVSEIPVVQVREIESMLKINNGDIAVIGGLMQDDINKSSSTVPILGSIPFVKSLFSYQNDTFSKTELVIFIRPVVVNEASINKDLSSYREFLVPPNDLPNPINITNTSIDSLTQRTSN